MRISADLPIRPARDASEDTAARCSGCGIGRMQVPGDIAVIGAGNVHYSDLLRIPLSTIDQSSSLLGETATEVLAQCIEAKKPIPPRRVLIPPRLVIRESSLRK